jgi:hypothetical protein
MLICWWRNCDLLSWCDVIHVSNPEVFLVLRMLRISIQGSAHRITASVHCFFGQNTATSVRYSLDKYFPVGAVWGVLRLHLEEKACKYGGCLRIYWIRSRGETIRGVSLAWDLIEGLITRKRYEIFLQSWTVTLQWLNDIAMDIVKDSVGGHGLRRVAYVRTSGGLLWKWQWTFGLHGISLTGTVSRMNILLSVLVG